ncbi:MAG: bifunctional oligoribonuclease/PAP phosphatase NrnA [Actinomycetota bacterium]
MTPGAAPPRRDPGGGPDVTVEEVAALLSDPGVKVAVASHRNPDGDAIGSMLGLARALRATGRDVVLWHVQPDPVPYELGFLVQPGERVEATLPADMAERVLVAVDCATADRVADAPPRSLARAVVNIDHHHDNTRYGTVNLVDGAASSSAEMVLRVIDALGLPLTAEVAEPLYVGLVTDTGRFGYSNTTPGAHAAAARLIAAGIDLPGLTRRLYEQQPLRRLMLQGRALASARSLLGGRLVVAVLEAEDFRAAGAGADDTEGIVEALRAAEGAEVAGLARVDGNGGLRVSLRAASERVDVSAIARVERGGGHRAAAGFTSHRSPDELVAWLERAVGAQLDAGETPG